MRNVWSPTTLRIRADCGYPCFTTCGAPPAATEELRDWLVSIRPDAPWPVLAADASDKEVEENADTQALRSTLAASGLPQDRQDMLFNLGLFHKREAKPAQWAVFDSAGKTRTI